MRASTTHTEVVLLLLLAHTEDNLPLQSLLCREQATSRPQLLRPEPSRCYGDACKPAVSHTNPKHLWRVESSHTHSAQRRIPATSTANTLNEPS